MLAGVIRRWRGSRADGLLCGAVVLAILSSCTNFDRDRFAVRVDADGKIEVLACEGALPAEVRRSGSPWAGTRPMPEWLRRSVTCWRRMGSNWQFRSSPRGAE